MSSRRAAFLLLCVLAGGVLLLAGQPVLGALTLPLALLAPWVALAMGQALLGLAILLGTADPPAHVLPAARLGPPGPPRGRDSPGPLRGREIPGLPRGRETPGPPRGRAAIALCLRNEALEPVLPPLHGLLAGLPAECFTLWFLSDTQDPALILAEDAALAPFLAAHPGARLRRRPDNAGWKAGNVMAFLDAEGADYDYLLSLDADSVMTPAAVLRLVAIMEADATIGLIQQLIVGRPVAVPFPRLFQFGMRAGMRAWATGQAWWQGPQGPYWGHNALIRVVAFRGHARLETLPGGQAILSHDQVEAIRLHEAGWGVWCWPEEAGSMEGNPPALPEFLARDLRWAAGNMQYLALIRQRGLGLMARWQLAQAILLFLCAPLWVLVFVLAVGMAATGAFDAVPGWHLAALMLAWWAAMHAPKLAGYVQVMVQGAAGYGGRARFALGAALEVLFTTVLSPISNVNKAWFLAALPFGARMGWLPQNRADRGVSWRDATRLLWPHSLAGVAAFGVLAGWAPWAIPFALPWAGGLVLAIPFCVLSTSPALGRWLAARGLAATPEENQAAESLAGSRLA